MDTHCHVTGGHFSGKTDAIKLVENFPEVTFVVGSGTIHHYCFSNFQGRFNGIAASM